MILLGCFFFLMGQLGAYQVDTHLQFPEASTRLLHLGAILVAVYWDVCFFLIPVPSSVLNHGEQVAQRGESHEL